MHNTATLEIDPIINDTVATPVVSLYARRAGLAARPARARLQKPQAARISDQDLEALVDGQLDIQTASRLEDALRSDSDARRRYQALKEQKRLLQLWWKQFS
jgi:GrpB-like predicted nucleotidyltransferase (UPF0157 family)